MRKEWMNNERIATQIVEPMDTSVGDMIATPINSNKSQSQSA